MTAILRACATGIMSHAIDCIFGVLLTVPSVVIADVVVGPPASLPFFALGGVMFLFLFIVKELWG